MNQEIVFGVSDFVGSLNQTLDYAYPSVTIVGELANLRISKGKWLYFDLKDEQASVRFFGTVYNLPGPLEDGLILRVSGMPRLHQAFGFSITVQNIRPVGEGSLKKAASLLEAKLRAEGLFDLDRKRAIPYPPSHVALITSSESAAYADFLKVLAERWAGVQVDVYDIQVQGEAAVGQIVAAIDQANARADLPEVIVLTRGGGSVDDLAAYSTEQVTRAIAGSRVPTLVAIGHEIDFSLAELAADQRASTPSNAAQLLTPEKSHELRQLQAIRLQAVQLLNHQIVGKQKDLDIAKSNLAQSITNYLDIQKAQLTSISKLLNVLSPNAALQRGYAIVCNAQGVVRSGSVLEIGQPIKVQLQDANITAKVTEISLK